MGERVELGGGHFAYLRDPGAVTERQRRPVLRAIMRVGVGTWEVIASLAELAKATPGDADGLVERIGGADMPAGDIAALDDTNDALAVALVESWSFTDTDPGTGAVSSRPVSVDTLVDLPAGDYTALLRAAAPHIVALLPSFAPSPADDSPTSPSSASGPSSRAATPAPPALPASSTAPSA